MAEIIKLDEYIEKHRYNILKATADALGMDPNSPADIEHVKAIMDRKAVGLSSTERYELEGQLVKALDAKDADAVRELFQVNEITWENDSMDHVDIAKGYNYRCLLQNEIARNNLMDWLEECGFDYLIDNDGRFAINCVSRESQYSVNRKVEHFTNKWDRPSPGINVDPESRNSRLKDPVRPALEGNVVQGPWKKEPEDQYPYEPSDESEPDPTFAYAAGGMDPVNLFKYAYQLFAQRMITGQTGGDYDTAIDSVETDIEQELSPHVKSNIIAKFEDEFGRDIAVQQAFKYGTAGKNVLVQGGMSEDEKDSTSFKDTSHSASPFTDETRDDEDEEDDNELNDLARQFEALDEGRRKTASQKEKEAKKKADAADPIGKGIGAKGLQKNKQSAGPHDIKKSKKGYDKKEGRKKIDVDETAEYFDKSDKLLDLFETWIEKLNEQYDADIEQIKDHAAYFLNDTLELDGSLKEKLIEGVLGNLMTMPSISRMQELAGLKSSCETERPDASMMTITVKPAPQDPGTPLIKDMPGAKEARDLMMKAFGIFDELNPNEQSIFKDCLIDNIMGTRVVENITEATILELKRVDEPLTQIERISVAKMLNKHWRNLIVDIDPWKNRTNDLAKVELAIILLRKVANRVGQGLV